MNITEILKELRAGKKITLAFNTVQDRENFRTRLYKTKKPEDTILEDVLDLEKMILRFVKLDETEPTGIKYKAKIWLENKPSEPDFEVTSIEE